MMRKRTIGSVMLVLAIVTGVPMSAAGATGCERASWALVRSANRGPADNSLRSVTTITGSDAWAVGVSSDPSTGSSRLLTQHWDGSAWAVVPAATGIVGSLLGVDAVATDDVWAVGSALNAVQGSTAVAVHWDGDSWVRVRVPKPEPGRFVSTVLTDVEAVRSDDVWAVGYWSTVPDAPPSPLIVHWDGTAWASIDSPALGTWSELQGVSASGPDDVWAVGNTEVRVGDAFVERALFEHWDGAAWQVVSTTLVARRAPFTLESVDVRSPRDAWAVGEITRARSIRSLSFHWDGARWTEVPTVNPSDTVFLAGVAISSRDRVYAVGSTWNDAQRRTVTLVERWNGSRWVRERTANRPDGNELFDVALRSSSVFAVGSHWANDGDGPQRTMVLRRCPR
ncbi:MAG TPA: hypothetical protein VFW51_04105 [Actinomycetota bacterium]|nr:hypothetical protein [Actinomycetota bacterium]